MLELPWSSLSGDTRPMLWVCQVPVMYVMTTRGQCVLLTVFGTLEACVLAPPASCLGGGGGGGKSS